MRFDFLLAKPLIGGLPVLFLLCLIAGLLLSPAFCAFMMCSTLFLVMPPPIIAEKAQFSKYLYGVLPVRRKNITRAHFCYIFLVHFAAEIIEILCAVLAIHLKLYRFLPNHNSAAYLNIQAAFAETTYCFYLLLGITFAAFLIFAYLELISNVFGRENCIKVIIVTCAVLGVIGFILMRSLKGIRINLPSVTFLAVLINLMMVGITLLFGEISAKAAIKREMRGGN